MGAPMFDRATLVSLRSEYLPNPLVKVTELSALIGAEPVPELADDCFWFRRWRPDRYLVDRQCVDRRRFGRAAGAGRQSAPTGDGLFIRRPLAS